MGQFSRFPKLDSETTNKYLQVFVVFESIIAHGVATFAALQMLQSNPLIMCNLQ